MSRRIRRGRRGIDLPLKNPPDSTDLVIGHDANGETVQIPVSGLAEPTVTAFTPTLTSTGTSPSINWATRYGRIARIGPLVHVEISLTWNSRSGGTGSPLIHFPSNVVAADNEWAAILAVRTDGVVIPSGRSFVIAHARPNESALGLVAAGSNTSGTPITVANMSTSGGSIRLGGTFLAKP